MGSMVAENWEEMDGHDWSDNFELSPRNHNLLMSLLDETQIDDDECDDERLKHVIRSLEAEIDCTSDFAWESNDVVDCESSIDDESNGRDLSLTRDDLDLHWMDVEIVPSSPSGDVDSWYMDHANEFGWLKNFSCLEADQDYGSLWHQTNRNLS